MDEPFELPVLFKDEELLFPARLLQQSYLHKFEVDVYGNFVYYEWDDEQNLRALVDPLLIDNKTINRDLLQAIAEAIESIVK